jgi:enoyl-CoA hydratase/carnithine racemase
MSRSLPRKRPYDAGEPAAHERETREPLSPEPRRWHAPKTLLDPRTPSLLCAEGRSGRRQEPQLSRPDASYETITVEHRGDAILLTLNRPDKLNAWDTQMAAELATAIRDANDDGGVGAIVMTGAGRGFCSGADFAMLDRRRAARASGTPETTGHGGMPPGLDWVELCRTSKPLVAAVNGIAIGVGVTMILPFDVIVASEAARFGIGLTKVGLLPELAASRFLVQRMGFGKASLFVLTGDVIGASDAAASNLVDVVKPADTFLDDALAIAGRMAANPRGALRFAKRLLTENSCEPDLDRAQTREDELNRQFCVTSPEHHEAIAAFRDKRPPRYDEAAATR